MSGVWHPTGRAVVSATKPAALAVCDRCGLTYNLKDLKWQFQWAGMQLQNLRILVCHPCLDIPSIQLKTIILPPDPVPLPNVRPEPYSAEVPSYMSEEDGTTFITTTGDSLVTSIQVTPTPDPNNSYLVPPDF